MSTSDSTLQPVVLLGAGGHAGVVLEALRLAGQQVVGVCDPALNGGEMAAVGDLPVINGDSLIESHPPADYDLVNGVGMLPRQEKRKALFVNMNDLGYRFANVIHPSAIVSDATDIRDGVQVMTGAIIQSDVSIDPQSIVNTGAQIDHGCRIGTLVHISPGAVLCGDVTVGDEAFIGAGATVINGIKIGTGAVIGAGAVIIQDVPDGAKIVTPSRRGIMS